MNLSTQLVEQPDALRLYMEALKKIIANYLGLLENRNISKEEENNIWAASFILGYMIASWEKYNRLLASLNLKNPTYPSILLNDKQAQIILKEFYKQLTIDPTKNLQNFIDEAQKIIQDKKFKAKTTTLALKYGIEGGIRTIGGILLFIALIYALLHIPAFLPPLLVVIVGTAIALSIPLIVSTGLDALTKTVEIVRARYSLPNSASLDYHQDTLEYSYRTVDESDNGAITQIRKTYTNNLTVAEIKHRFFQPQMNKAVTLEEEVQTEFNALNNALNKP